MAGISAVSGKGRGTVANSYLLSVVKDDVLQ